MRGNIQSYRDLEVWQKGVELVVAVYQHTKQLPRHEAYGLASQMQRAAASIPANVAEGHGRKHRKEFLNFLSTAHGSLMELETHLIVAQRLGYLNEKSTQEILAQTAELGRMLNGLIRSLRRSASVPDPWPLPYYRRASARRSSSSPRCLSGSK